MSGSKRVIACLIVLTILGGQIVAQEVKLTSPEVYQNIPTRRDRAGTVGTARTHVNSQNFVRPQPSIRQNTLRVENIDTAAPGLSAEIVQSPPLMSQPPAAPVPTVEPQTVFGPDDGPARIDLRDFLPEPGRQQRQNCVAWAIGYASYSCQVCQQRRKKNPTRRHDIFSPSFIYNKLNGDRDDGLIVTDAITFIHEHGCATLQTMPLGTATPDASADKEAFVYRPWDHERAENVGDLRYYLQHGYPVILVIRNDAVFNGRQRLPEPFRWEKTRDEMNADFDTYGPHAICAVGYDDQKQAILVMNSLGSDWKDGGFCWVDYRTLATIPSRRTDSTALWCLEAHVVKIKESVPINLAMQHRIGRIRFQLLEDGKVYCGGDRVSPDSWRIGDMACNDQTLFLLRNDQLVASLNNLTEVINDEESAVWDHLVLGLPQDSVVTMMAAVNSSPLFSLTSKGGLFEYIPQQHRWEPVRISGASDSAAGQMLFVDLRDSQSQGPLCATTATGQVLMFDSDKGWTSP
ncbi:MAG: C1 family peptidase [Planctomycetaceae bacterium]